MHGGISIEQPGFPGSNPISLSRAPLPSECELDPLSPFMLCPGEWTEWSRVEPGSLPGERRSLIYLIFFKLSFIMATPKQIMLLKYASNLTKNMIFFYL